MTEQLIEQLGYVGITLILILGGLGLPIPEEVPIIVAAVLTRNGQMTAPLALASCLAGVLLGDMVVYFLGFFYGEKVISLPLTRRLLTRQREAQIKGYFHRHGFKILVSGRFVPGFRTAAYLTAGILKLPTLKLLVIDLVAVSLSTFLMFGLGYAFAFQIQKGIREVQQWVTIVVAGSIAVWLLIRYYKARRRAGLGVGPPVLESADVAFPASDHRAGLSETEPPMNPVVSDSASRRVAPGSDGQQGSRETPAASTLARAVPAAIGRGPDLSAPAARLDGSVPVEAEPSRTIPPVQSRST